MKGAKHILFIVENSTVPLDLRVWREALTLKDMGYEVSVIGPKKGEYTKNYEILSGIEIYRHPMPYEASDKMGYVIEYFNAIIYELYLSVKIFLKKPFHYIHAANPPDNIFIIALFFKPFGVKYVFDHHDICPELYYANFNRKDIFYKTLLLFEKISFKVANLVISTNESYKKIAIKRGHKKKEEVFVVRNGPDLLRKNNICEKYEYKNGFNHLVAYIGVIGLQERIDILLRAAYYIINKKGMSDIKFVIIGPGPNLEKMIQLSKNLSLDKYVEFTGYIPDPDFYNILAAADICVNPELKNEYTDKSTMIKTMEYMFVGKPIVQFETTEGKASAGAAAINVTSNDEMRFAETIIELIQDKAKIKKMGEVGKNRIHDMLSWNKQEINLKNAYEYLDTTTISTTTKGKSIITSFRKLIRN